MAHFAHLVDGVVRRVHVVANPVITDEDGVEQESLGKDFLAGLHGYSLSDVVQCSYNANFRGVYPSRGYTYDEANDVFVAPVIEEAPEDGA